MIKRWIILSLVIYATCWLLPGISVESFWTAALVAIILPPLNLFVKPPLIILTLPVTVLTMGLFLFVINAAMLMLIPAFVDGFEVAGFWWAILGSLIISALYNFIIFIID